MRRLSRASFAFAGILWLTGAHVAAAQSPQQAPAYFVTLTVPPNTVGTCMPAPGAGAGADGGDLRGYHLVMTSRGTGSRREMTVYTDRAGRVRRYSETVHRMTGATTSVGENVTAVVAPDGRVAGPALSRLRDHEPPQLNMVVTTRLPSPYAHASRPTL